MAAKRFSTSLFIFRRDLRLQDNTALIRALEESESVIPCFIFDPRQIDNNSYRGEACVTFMLESLQDLSLALERQNARLYLFHGIAEEVVSSLIQSESIDAVYVNRDYTPFSRKRDAAIKEVVENHAASFVACSDLLLTEIGAISTGKGTPYTIYSYFAKKAAMKDIPEPRCNNFRNYCTTDIAGHDHSLIEHYEQSLNRVEEPFAQGGRQVALEVLRDLTEFLSYDDERNFPEKGATTGLSPHNKFGTVSIREVYHAVMNQLGRDHTLIKELFWRDFFTHISFHFPHVFGKPFHQKYSGIAWRNDRKEFDAWCSGKTGFPIVDAGMRELNATGFMHNRVRMIVASFLMKDLHINWRWGEKYFAKKLVDYDPAVNNGNWQWAASTGCDAQPYFRIFNPWLQGKKFDPDCVYIKRWVPELRPYSSKEIHGLEKGKPLIGYVPALVDHRESKEIAEEIYQEAMQANEKDR